MKTIADIVEAESKRIAALRIQMLEQHPFWGYLLLQTELIAATELPTYCATDAFRYIWFNPLRTQKLSIEEFNFILLHLLYHQILAVSGRSLSREPLKWSQAVDYSINSMIIEVNYACLPIWHKNLYELPDGALFSPKYYGWIIELIYEDLCKQEKGHKANALNLVLPTANQQNISFSGTLDHQGAIDLHLPIELSIEQKESLYERISAAAENYQANLQAGHMPGDYLREIGILSEAKVPWQVLLQRFAYEVLGKDDYSLKRPNKRYLMQDLLAPGLYSEKIPSIVVALDTSASMSKEQLREACSEINAITENAEEITLIIADCKIQEVIKFAELEKFLQNPAAKGDGGTSHIPVFEYIAKKQLNPDLFIGMSDLYSYFPDKKPNFPVIWLAPENHGDAPWGKIIKIPN